MFRKSFLFSALAFAFLLPVGCSDDDDFNQQLANAFLRAIHASPDTGAVDIYVEGVSTPLFSNLAYGETRPFISVASGTYVIQIRPAGAPATSAPVFETGNVQIGSGLVISAVAVGLSTAAPGSDEALRVLPLVEDFGASASGMIRVRILHGSATAPTVAIDVGDDGAPEVRGLQRYADTGAEGVMLPANQALQVGILADASLARVTAFTIPALPEGSEVIVIATGLLEKLPREDDGFALLAIGPTAAIGFIQQNPVLYALHASPDADPVDILAGGAVLVGNLGFGQLSDTVQVPPGAYELDFRLTGSASIFFKDTTPALQAGWSYLAVATGFATGGAPGFQVLPFAEGFDGDPTDALLTLIHASPDAPRVDVGPSSNGNVTALADFTDIGFGESSGAAGTMLPVASLTIGVAETGTTNAVAEFDLTIPGGLRAYGIAIGSLLGTGESFRLLIVDTSTSPWTAAAVAPNP
jgi:hypothetical protein